MLVVLRRLLYFLRPGINLTSYAPDIVQAVTCKISSGIKAIKY